MKIIEEFRVVNVGDKEVGIEIEMEGRNLPSIRTDIWRSEEDHSLRGESMEYVSARALLRKEVGPALETLQKYLKDCNATLRPSDNAGVHVHINCQQLEFDYVLRMACLYYIFEDLLVKFCGPNREGNLFCLRAKDSEYIIDRLRRCAMRGSFRGIIHNEYRYSALNFASLAKFGTLEFRSMRCVDDFSVINTWVDMLLKIKDVAGEFKSCREIVEGLSAKGADQFLSSIFGDMGELIRCSGQGRLIMEGVRRVQDFAFIQVEEKANQKKSVDDEIAVADLRAAELVDRAIGEAVRIRIRDEAPAPARPARREPVRRAVRQRPIRQPIIMHEDGDARPWWVE